MKINMKTILAKHKFPLIASFLANIAYVSLEILNAFVFQRLVDYVSTFNLTGALMSIGILLIILAFTAVFMYLMGYFFNRYLYSTMLAIKNRLFTNFINSNYATFHKRNEGEYLNTLTTLTDNLRMEYITPIYRGITSLTLTFFSLVAIFFFNPIMGFLSVFILLIQTGVPVLRRNITSRVSENYANETEMFSSKSIDLLGGFELIISQNIRRQVFNIFSGYNKKLEQSRLKLHNTNYLSNALIFFVQVALILTPWILGVILIINGVITFGVLLAIDRLNASLTAPFAAAVADFNRAIAGREFAKKIESDLEVITDKENFNLSSPFENIVLENVNYSYDEKKVLTDVNFIFESGKKYAVMGKSGSGKSTLGKILSGILTDYTGKMYINNIFVNSNETNLFKVIGYVPQETYLFNDSLKNNITLYRDFSEEKLSYILDKLDLENIVNSSEEYKEGQQWSGGQKQRVGIARVLIRDTPVIILDEATSSLDAEMYRQIETFILNLENVTVISITHRLEDGIKNFYDNIFWL